MFDTHISFSLYIKFLKNDKQHQKAGRKKVAKKRTQTVNPKTGLYVKRDAATGKFISEAVWLFYCLIKNHPFFNGNKRVAVVALFDF